jgi:nucleotide-binding universal stress UspA family protein
MRTEDQLELEREVTATPRADDSAGAKSILLHIQDDKSLDSRLETALALARASGGHIRCLHITPIEAYVAFDTFGGIFVMDDVIEALTDQEKALRQKVEDQLRNEDVTWDYVEVTGNVIGQIVRHGALADVIVTSREPHRADFAGPAIGIMGELLHRARTPLLIPGTDQKNFDPTGVALIGWNGSYECANTVRSSIELLKLASEVRVVSVEEQKAGEFPATALLEYLSRHGIHAEMRVESSTQEGSEHQFVAGTLVSHAIASKAAYLLVGGYGHGRVAEYVFGGVTRTLLHGCPIALVIGH